MIRIESHPDYMTLQMALLDLRMASLENEEVICAKQRTIKSTSSPAVVQEIKLETLQKLNEQNTAVSKDFEDYFTETQQMLSTTERSLDYARDGKFQGKIQLYQAQLELIGMRLKSSSASNENSYEVFPCRGKWYVSKVGSTEILGEFDSQLDAEAYAKTLRRGGILDRMLPTL